jgi:hypothetical protein
VDHDGKKAVFELKNRHHTFYDIKYPIAKQFALPPDSIFFKMEDSDEVLLPNLLVLPILFPMITSKIKGQMPCLRISMRANMSTMDYILGEEKAKSMLKAESDAIEAAHQ